MKKLVCTLFLLLILLCGCSKKNNDSVYDKIIKNDEIVVGVKTDTKPFGFIDEKTGQNDGFDVDIAKYIARDILGSDKKIKFVSVNPSNRIESVTSGKVDMVIATMSVTPNRQFLIDFSTPYYVAGQTAVVKKNSDIYNFNDLKKYTSIVVLGTDAEDNLKRVVPNAKIIGYINYKDAFDALIEGKGDAFVTDDTILFDFVYRNKNYRLLKSKLSIEPYAVAVKQEDGKKLKNSLDIIINRLNSDGTIKYLKKKWHL